MISALFAIGLAPTASAVETGPQSIPNGLKRVMALENDNLDVVTNGLDDKRVDVDVAVIDSGIDLDHPDLNVVEGVDCLAAVSPSYACTANPSDGNDENGHGTGVSLGLAALDNGLAQKFSVGIGVAPGARLWALKAIPNPIWGKLVEATKQYEEGKAWTAPVYDLQPSIAAVKWVTAHAAEIEVLHYAPYCTTSPTPNLPQPVCGNASQVTALETAIKDAIKAGLVVVSPAGNWRREIKDGSSDSFPARIPGVITVSALFDSDGLPGANGPEGLIGSPPNPEPCNKLFKLAEKDDTSAYTSHYGAGVDMIAPGPCASGAAPHVSGAAALLASTGAYPTDDEADVAAIRNAIVGAGNTKSAAEGGWDDKAPDAHKEPLVDLSSEAVFNPKYVHSFLGLQGAELPKVVKNTTTGQPCGKLEISWPQVNGGCVIKNVASTFVYRTSASCGSSKIELGELHIGPDGYFAADNIGLECSNYGAQRCDAEPNDYLHYFPERQAKSSLHLPPWTGVYYKAGGVPYVYLALCSVVAKKGPDAKWIDYVVLKLNTIKSGSNTLYGWTFFSSGSKAWESLSFGHFETTSWIQQAGALIEWN